MRKVSLAELLLRLISPGLKWGAVVLVTACAHQPSPPATEPETIVEVVPEVSAKDLNQKKIRHYLFNALEALDNGRLMRPRHDNAYDWFAQVLQLDAAHPEAHRGMREIGKAYLRLAEEAFEAGDRDRAELMLARALKVSAGPEDVEQLRRAYPLRPQADNEYRLVVADLNGKSEQLVAQLAELALRAKSMPSRLLIIARNDTEGRWIYKQMRSAVQGYRLRGNIKVGRVPKVVLIDMPVTAAENNKVGVR